MLFAEWLDEIMANESADWWIIQLPSDSVFSHRQRAGPTVDNQAAEETDGWKADVPRGVSQQPDCSCQVTDQHDEMGCYDQPQQRLHTTG